MHIDKGANEGGGKAIIFNTITISDGISMGSEGMKYSLVSREVIADSIETVVGCGGMDGFSFSALGRRWPQVDEVRRTDYSYRAGHDEFAGGNELKFFRSAANGFNSSRVWVQ